MQIPFAWIFSIRLKVLPKKVQYLFFLTPTAVLLTVQIGLHSFTNQVEGLLLLLWVLGFSLGLAAPFFFGNRRAMAFAGAGLFCLIGSFPMARGCLELVLSGANAANYLFAGGVLIAGEFIVLGATVFFLTEANRTFQSRVPGKYFASGILVVLIVIFGLKDLNFGRNYDGVPRGAIRACAGNVNDVAGKEAPWESGCVRSGFLPAKRFVSGERFSDGSWSICIETGGIGVWTTCYHASYVSGKWIAKRANT